MGVGDRVIGDWVSTPLIAVVHGVQPLEKRLQKTKGSFSR